MGEAGEEYSAGCSLSLMCQEDSTDLDGVFVDGAAGGELVLVYSDAGEYEDDDEEEYVGHLVSKESSFCWSPSSPSSSDGGAESSMAAEDWFPCARRDTVKWILETRAYFGFGHRTAYLAVSYFDRFCLRRCIDRSVMPWATRLLAVACVSIAAKMEEYLAPPLSEFRPAGADECGFCCGSIRRMELLVLSTLDWRMGDVTPFDYLPCLSSRLLRRGNGGGGGLVAAKAAALIFSTAQAASVLDYRPSTVAAAAVLAATRGALTKEALESKMINFSPSFLLEKEDVFACYSLMLSESSPPPSATVKRLSSCSGTYDSSDELADEASFAPAANNNKRMRLDLPGIGGR